MTDTVPRGAVLVIGAGDHLGGAIARRFARGGYHVVCTRRRGDFAPLLETIREVGGTATGIHSDARDEDAVIELFDTVERDIAPLAAMVFNVGGNVHFSLTETTARVYRKVWEMCAFAAFLNGREAARRMLPRGRGTILFTGATASLRGAAGFCAFAGGKHALRALAQTMSRELGPQGLHVGHVIVDGPIENDNSRALFPQAYANRAADAIMQPDDIAEIYWHLHQQPRNAWSFETEVRAYAEKW